MQGRFVSAARVASAAGHAGRGSPLLGRVLLVAVAVVAVGAFVVLQVRARAGRRPAVAGRGRLGARYDWRTLPPPADDPLSSAEQDGYGPLWRYGVPLGYGRVYDPGYRSAPAPGQAPGYGTPGYAAPGREVPGYAEPGYAEPGYEAPGYAAPGYAEPGYEAPGYAAPGYGAGNRRPWDVPDGTSRDSWS